MLDGLDAIDWSKLEHAYGEASDVPELIRALVSEEPNPPVKDPDEEPDLASDPDFYALETLFSTIWHQGTVYPATAKAVPFLIEILEQRMTATPDGILYLLSSCGRGNGYLEVHGSLDHYRDQRGTTEFDATIDTELQAVYAAHDAVEAGIDIYIPFLDDENKAVRRAATEVLCICYQHKTISAAVLKKRIEIERYLSPETSIITDLVNGLGIVLVSTGRQETQPFEAQDNHLFMDWMADETFPETGRVVASYFLVHYGDEVGRERALAFIDRIPDTLSTSIGYQVYGVTRALCKIDVQRAIQWLDRMTTYPVHDTVGTVAAATSDLFATHRVEAEPLVNILRKLLVHEDVDIRQRAVQSIVAFVYVDATLKTELENLSSSETNRNVKQKYQYLFNRLNEPSFLMRSLDEYLRYDAPEATTLQQMLDEIESLLTERPYAKELAGLLGAVGDMGADALHDPRTLPVLQQAITLNDQWNRIWGARALAFIAPHDQAMLSVLVEEIRGRPVAFIAMDTLMHLARSGVDVSSALPHLRILAESPLRQLEFGSGDHTPFQDEQLRQMALETITVIEEA